MSALVHVITEKDLSVILKYRDAEGVVLISQSIAVSVEEKLGRPIDGEYLDDYDFGGEPDKYVDLVLDPNHFVIDKMMSL